MSETATAEVAPAIAQAESVQAPTVIPTAELPSISVYELIDGEPVEVLDNSGLPAPVITTNTSGANQDPSLPTPIPTDIPPTPTATHTPMATVPADTPTPAPTFTVPALPQTSAEDHYWLLRPVEEGGIVWTNKTYSYGSTRNGTLRTHHGVEFDVGYDTPIIAAADGIVVTAGLDVDADIVGPEPDFYGNVVVIEHDFSWQGEKIFTLYGHLNQVSVTKGQRVSMGDVLGLSGATGVADGPHLHFEVRQGSNDYANTRNPLLWLWPFPEDGTLAGKVTFENGALALEAPVSFRRIDGADATVKTVTSYAEGAVNGDTVFQENFAADDVDAGYYEIWVKVGNQRYKQEVWVYPRTTTFVDIVIPNP
ncbi:MAG: M23 family metallopeptidase [Chloroflexota bacterium]